MKEIVDARGLACPQPVILTKKALETKDEITVLVDNTTALENVKRFALNSNCLVEIKEEAGVYSLNIIKKQRTQINTLPQEQIPCVIETSAPKGPVVVVLSSDKMGTGPDDLGMVLMRSFIHTLTELDRKPDIMVLYNSGVKLSVEGSDVLHNLQALEAKGVKILVCGTCLNFFNLKENLRVGSVSNMFDITNTLFDAKHIIKP